MNCMPVEACIVAKVAAGSVWACRILACKPGTAALAPSSTLAQSGSADGARLPALGIGRQRPHRVRLGSRSVDINVRRREKRYGESEGDKAKSHC